MKKIILFILLLLPVASFAEETTDDMTTIYEEHFDGWLYFHTSGMNATYTTSGTVSLQYYKISGVENGFPCLKIKSGSLSITVYNNTGANGDLILSYKDYNKNISVSVSQGKTKKNLATNSDGTYTIKNIKGTNPINLEFEATSAAYIDDIVIKAPTSSISTSQSADLSLTQSEMSANIGTMYSSTELLENPYNLPIKWYSSNQAIATVDESGNVTPHFIGTTTIYAIFEGNDNYAYQAVSYQLTTKRESLANEVYYAGFADYIGMEGNGGNFENNAYVGDFNYTGAFSVDSKSSSLLKGYQCLKVETSYTVNDLEKLGVKNGTLSFRCAPSSTKGNSLTVTLKYSDNTTDEQVIDMSKKQWFDISISINKTSQLSSISFSGQKFFLDEISIISEDYVTIGSTGYATLYYSGRALKVPTGLKAYTMKV